MVPGQQLIEQAPQLPQSSPLHILAQQTVSHMPSQHTRRAYSTHIESFLSSGHQLTREGVGEWLTNTTQRSKSSANQGLAAIKKLAREAWLRKLISNDDYFPLKDLKASPDKSVRMGNWLTIEGAKKLIALPLRNTIAGTRDAAIFSLLLGCGLRRTEAAEITWDKYQEREDRMCLVDFVGKGDKRRTVPVPEWARRDLDRWRKTLIMLQTKSHEAKIAEHGQCSSCLRLNSDCRSLDNHSAILRSNPWVARGKYSAASYATSNAGKRHYEIYVTPLTDQSIWYIVKEYAKQSGVEIRPHDLRRTLAKLMRSGGADLEQIQLTLGHSKLETTEKYLGGALQLAFGEAGVDRVKLLEEYGPQIEMEIPNE